MALKIFCDACQSYIRDARPNDDLTGQEICVNCKEKMQNTFTEVDRIAKRAISTIQKKQSAAQAKLEEAMRRVIDGEDEKELGD